MSLTQILGIAAIASAYGLIWYFVIQGKRSVEEIDRNGLSFLWEIRKYMRNR